MLCLCFHCGDERYALDTAGILVVTPWPPLRPLPKSPPEVAGIFNHHGTMVPVVDLTMLISGQPTRRLLSSRLVIVNHPVDGGGHRQLGLLVERAWDTERFGEGEFADSGVSLAAAPYLQGTAARQDGIVQIINIDKLLSEKMRGVLFEQGKAATA